MIVLFYLSLIAVVFSLQPTPRDYTTKLQEELDAIKVESSDPNELKEKIKKVQEIGHRLKMKRTMEERTNKRGRGSMRELKVDPRMTQNEDLGDVENKFASGVELGVQRKIAELRKESHRLLAREERKKK